MSIKFCAVIMLAFVAGFACSHQPVPTTGTRDSSDVARGGVVSIMTFNVENLFDTTHDANKNDHTFLPKTAKDNDEHRERCNQIEVRKWREQCLYWDWSEAALEFKLRVIANVIAQVNDGRGPDIIAFQEVENVGVLDRLRTEFLTTSGYLAPVLVEGNDVRGIDVGFLTRLPVVGTPIIHPIDFESISERRRADTRGILQTDFRLPDGRLLTGYNVHFPAPFHPYRLRIDAYKSLNALVDGLPRNRLAFAAGDFNTPSLEDKEHRLLEQYVKPKWLIAHQLGCDDCKGTSYYPPKDDWSFLDMILVRTSTDRSGYWGLNNAATRLVNTYPEQRTEQGYPRRFSNSPPGGVSDHWPLLIELNLQESN